MLHESILLSLTLATSPTAVTAPNFADQLAYAELVTSNDDGAQIVGFDHVGQPIASIALWRDDDGAYHLEMDYDDGYASTVVVDDRERTTTNLPDDVLAERARLLAERLRTPTIPQKGAKAKCAKTLALAGTLCAPLVFAPVWAVAIGIVSCPTGIVEAWCKCGDALGYKTGADVCD